MMGSGPGIHRVFELSEFLLDELGVQNWPLRGNRVTTRRTLAYHSACHGRILNLDGKPKRVLGLIQGVSVVEPEQSEQCCGFGGAFSAKMPDVSIGIGLEKLMRLEALGAKTVVSGDMGCLMHLEGLAKKQGLDLDFRHYAEILAGELR
jgi:L-lactate dehydrogenase complex protein LldE